ncbi:MAG: nuclear transport factor 2 family protein [Leptolyngbyaceae cyanobacterium bins.59]|nr:nuclear transport factor 2 family protein [Leptolyngbyaceae cyanobacterium bins.59]
MNSINFVSRSLLTAILCRLFLLVPLVGVAFPQPVIAVDLQEKDHKAIIQTREIALKAINTRDFSTLQPYLHPTFTITTVDNQIFSNIQDFEKYWSEQLKGPIDKIEMSVKADAPTTLLAPETGVAHGNSLATFNFKDGNVRTMAMRWTAVMQKFQGKWTIQTLHFSSSLLDNPVLRTTQEVSQTLAIGAGVGGLLLGAIGGVLVTRRSRRGKMGNG